MKGVREREKEKWGGGQKDGEKSGRTEKKTYTGEEAKEENLRG